MYKYYSMIIIIIIIFLIYDENNEVEHYGIGDYITRGLNIITGNVIDIREIDEKIRERKYKK